MNIINWKVNNKNMIKIYEVHGNRKCYKQFYAT